jgi:hypothetical protein
MDGITILIGVTLILVVLSGIILALIAVRITRDRVRGRGAVVLIAFFLPAIYVAYLLTADHYRNEYHRVHSKAYDSDGYCNLVLGNGYELWYFDETPWMSSIGKLYTNAQITNIQRLTVTNQTVVGQTGTTEMLDGPTDYFFSLDLASGEIRKFGNEEELRSKSGTFGHLERPEDLFNAEFAREHGWYFWPLVCLIPLVFTLACWRFMRRKNTMQNLQSLYPGAHQ